jgi:hypothetical protein
MKDDLTVAVRPKTNVTGDTATMVAKTHLNQFHTPDALSKTRIARDLKIAEGADLKSDFKDDNHWVELAAKAGKRLPQWWLKPETRFMRRWFKFLGVVEKDYLQQAGLTRLLQFAELNPRWPLRAWCGLLLEWHSEQKA